MQIERRDLRPAAATGVEHLEDRPVAQALKIGPAGGRGRCKELRDLILAQNDGQALREFRRIDADERIVRTQTLHEQIAIEPSQRDELATNGSGLVASFRCEIEHEGFDVGARCRHDVALDEAPEKLEIACVGFTGSHRTAARVVQFGDERCDRAVRRHVKRLLRASTSVPFECPPSHLPLTANSQPRIVVS